MKYAWIRTTYLYIVALITLLISLVNAAMLANMALKIWVFPEAAKVEEAQRGYFGGMPYPAKMPESEGERAAQNIIDCKEKCGFTDEQKKSAEQWISDYERFKKAEGNITGQRQLEAARSLGFLVISLPIFWYHWMIIRKEAALAKREKEQISS